MVKKVMTPVEVEKVDGPSVPMGVPKDRQYFSHDMKTMVGLDEMEGSVICGAGKAGDYTNLKQLCGNTGKCYFCSALANGRKLKDCMKESVRAGAVGLNQAVRNLWDQGVRDHRKTVETMYDYLVKPENVQQRKDLSHYGAVRVTRDRARANMGNGMSPNNLWVMLVVRDDGKSGIVVYSDEGNLAYKAYLDWIVPKNDLAREKSGDVVEAILGMLWLHQTVEGFDSERTGKGIRQREQEIMDMVETDVGGGTRYVVTTPTTGDEMKENIEKLQLMVQKVGELVEPTKNQVDAMCGAMESMREGVMTIVHKLDHLHDVSGKGRNESMKLMSTSSSTMGEIKTTVDALNDKITQVGVQNDRILVKLDGVTTVKAGDDEAKKHEYGWNVLVDDEEEKERLRALLEEYYRERHSVWLEAQTKTKQQVKELLDLGVEDMNDGLKHLQGRLFKTINNFDEDGTSYGFDMEGKMWMGIGDAEKWIVKNHARNLTNLMSVVRGTQDHKHRDNAYRLLVLNVPNTDRAFVFVGCHYNKSRGASSWEDDPQAKRHRKW